MSRKGGYNILDLGNIARDFNKYIPNIYKNVEQFYNNKKPILLSGFIVYGGLKNDEYISNIEKTYQDGVVFILDCKYGRFTIYSNDLVEFSTLPTQTSQLKLVTSSVNYNNGSITFEPLKLEEDITYMMVVKVLDRWGNNQSVSNGLFNLVINEEYDLLGCTLLSVFDNTDSGLLPITFNIFNGVETQEDLLRINMFDSSGETYRPDDVTITINIYELPFTI